METRKERPIIIPRPEMVQAILEDRKTQHRWPMKPQPYNPYITRDFRCAETSGRFAQPGFYQECPYRPGDILWVKETWRVISEGNYCVEGKTVRILHIEYKSGWDGKRYPQKTFQFILPDDKDKLCNYKVGEWRSPIFMPRWASRIKLEIINIRIERVQNISFDDCLAEGVVVSDFWSDSKLRPTVDEMVEVEKIWPRTEEDPIAQGWVDYTRLVFKKLWDSIYAKKGLGWNVNPWVWAIAFRRVENNEGQD